MKTKLKKILPCLAILTLFVFFDYQTLQTYYDEVLDNTGLVQEDFEEKLKKENLRAAESEEEYQNMVAPPESTTDTERTDRVADDLKLHSLSSLLLDADNNRVLYEENGFQKMPMASTTKIMTCIVTLENGNLSDVVTISAHAAKMPDVQLNVRAGEQFYLKDLLYSLMLESHNDVAVAIAEHVGGSVEGFATMMNDKARSLGCMDTNFVTPNGLDAEGHYTTAKDLAVIASYAIKNEQFVNITNTASHQFSEIKKGRGFRVSNKNKFLYMMEGAIGVKTGFTGKAGYCFVGAIKKMDRTLVSVVLGCGWPPSKNLKWKDTSELMSYGIKNFEKKNIYVDTQLDPLLIKDGQSKLTSLHMEGDLTLLMRDEETVHIKYDLPKVINAPVKENEIVGYANYYIDNVFYDKIPIYTTEAVDKINFKFCLNKLMKLWSVQYD